MEYSDGFITIKELIDLEGNSINIKDCISDSLTYNNQKFINKLIEQYENIKIHEHFGLKVKRFKTNGVDLNYMILIQYR